MKALVYHGPGKRSWEDVPDPVIVDPTDAIVRIDSSTICGTDLHILKGDVPEVQPGTILGHEAVGTVVSVGAAVTTLEEGDRVLVSCITSCGRCRFCKEAPLRPLHGRRRLGLRSPHRRPPGRVRTGAVRRHVRVQGARRAHGRAGALPRGHLADRFRVRRAERPRRAGRHRRDRWCRPDRPGGDHDGQAVHARQDRGDRPRRLPACEGDGVRRGHRDQQRPRGCAGPDSGADGRARRRRGDRGGRGARHLRALHRADPTGRSGRQRRRPRLRRDAPSGASVDP